jgi:hypothetical protein
MGYAVGKLKFFRFHLRQGTSSQFKNVQRSAVIRYFFFAAGSMPAADRSLKI